MHHSIVKSPQAQAEEASGELAAAKQRAEALEAQLKDLGVEPAVRAPVAAPAVPTVIRHNMVPGVGNAPGAMHHQIVPAGGLAHATQPSAAPVAQFDAVTRVRDEVPGDTIIANQYAPTGQYDQNGRPIEAIVGQIAIPKINLGLRPGEEIVHVSRVAVHAAATQSALEHQRMLIAQGKLRAPGQVVAKRLPMPTIGETIEREEAPVQPVSHADVDLDKTATRFALIELGDGKR
jgi:hypothetical protein